MSDPIILSRPIILLVGNRKFPKDAIQITGVSVVGKVVMLDGESGMAITEPDALTLSAAIEEAVWAAREEAERVSTRIRQEPTVDAKP